MPSLTTNKIYTMSDITLTNPTHLTFLLQLDAVWEHQSLCAAP